MSTFARDGENANSAVLVNITPEDFNGDSPLEGMYFQQELEEKAFKLGRKQLQCSNTEGRRLLK